MNQAILDLLTSWRTNNGFAADDSSALSTTQTEKLVTELQAEIAKISVRPFDPTGTFSWRADANPLGYGGRFSADVQGFEAAKAISHSSGGGIFYITDPPAGKLLNDSALRGLVADVIGGSNAASLADQIFDGKFVDNVRASSKAIGNLLAISDFVSQRMMIETAHGDVRILAPFAENGRVLGDTELPSLLVKEAVTKLNGIPKAVFQAVYDIAFAKGGVEAA